ncbi:hypothetical protein HY416_01045 [Candidatus Kaiserbacteria bacterium]|nr:hypothetical protein [Candidatus Kaiserbacteria bacterium]
MFEIKYRSDTTTPGSAGAGRGVRSSIVTVAPPKAPTCTNVNSLSEISGKDGHYCVHLKAGVDSGIYRPPGGRKMDITINAPGEVSYFDSKNNLIDKPVLVAGTGDNLRFLPGWAAFSVKLAVDGTVTLLLEKI